MTKEPQSFAVYNTLLLDFDELLRTRYDNSYWDYITDDPTS